MSTPMPTMAALEAILCDSKAAALCFSRFSGLCVSSLLERERQRRVSERADQTEDEQWTLQGRNCMVLLARTKDIQ